MLAYYVALAYTIVNPLIALWILFRSRRNVLSKFYSFCVAALCTLGVVGHVLSNPVPGFPVRLFEQTSAFLYSLFPFFFLHFMLVFVRRYEILKSRTIIVATYFAGLFCYLLVLLKLVANPFASGISNSGYVYYLTWMSILFSIGVALMYSLVGGFAERGMKSNVLFVAFALLMLLLPTPFTESIFSIIPGDNVSLYFGTSIGALGILVFIVFRHRIVMNMPYQAMKTALGAMNDIIIKTDLDLKIEMAQGALLPLLGYAEKELMGKDVSVIMDDPTHLREFRDTVVASNAGAVSFEVDVSSKQRDRLQMDFSFTPVFANEEITGFVGVGRNITEKKRLEAQLRQAQKMEILGTLAGGVAHDFNNLLAIIYANASVVERVKANPEKTGVAIDSIKATVHHGTAIVSQLLTFARKTEAVFESIDVNTALENVVTIMRSALPKSINISTTLAPDMRPIWADKNQISQALLNLCVNARDAIVATDVGGNAKGSLSLCTRIVEHQGLHTRFADATPGRYVDITASDDGVGMNEVTKNRIFEPFFSTKDPGKGTGLGLAVVYGVMKSHQGFIDVESTLGKGTTFHLYFPIRDTIMTAEKSADAKHAVLRGAGQTLLIIDDEEELLKSLCTSFEHNNYKVLSARDGEEAMRLFRKHVDEIDVALVDVDIPNINGVELFKLLMISKPTLKGIFCTGLHDAAFDKRMRDVGGRDVIRKPFSFEEIAQRVRDILKEVPVDG
jgi:PAS domain S-box-containing protein